MKYTNRQNLPEAIVNAVTNDSYSRGDADISVTQLIDPPRKVALTHAHGDELTEDVGDRIWSLLGQAVHVILERANVTGVAERRLSMRSEGWKISGAVDVLTSERVLQDYKLTSVYSLKDGVKMEHAAQLNINAEILRQNGQKVSRLQIVGILRDWSQAKAQTDRDYPQSQVIVMDVPMWPIDYVQKYIRERVILHQQARVTLPECTPEERWAESDVWAVMKAGRKSAIRNYPSEEEAIEHVRRVPGTYVQHRPASGGKRCAMYCAALAVCEQGQRLVRKPTKLPEAV